MENKLKKLTIYEEKITLSILRSEFDLAFYNLKQNKIAEIDTITEELFKSNSTKIKDALNHLTRDTYNKEVVTKPKKQIF